MHLMGLASDVGVHSRLGHLFGCLELCAKLGHDKVTIHCFTDGRDSGPFTGKGFIERIEAKCAEIGIGRIASICGRYYAMDRDNRWERVKLAYDMLTGRSQLPQFATATEAMQDYYDNPSNNSQRGDEFVMPRVVGDACAIGQGDSVIFYNYRGDRPREITRAFVMDNFYGHVPPSPDSGEKGFDRGEKLDLYYVTMTAYEQQLNELVNVAFEKPAKMPNIGGEYISNLALTQFRCAETEKFPHVTFFFNDYRDEPFAGESRQMAQSPKVATYDLQPQMSAPEIGEIILKRLAAEDCEDFILVNFANGDMVGHTGVLAAAITAVETVDTWVGRIAEVALARGGALIVTADHGNAEQMFDPTTNAPHTAHTTFDVQCIVVDADNQNAKLREGGRLADIMPTALDLMGLDVPGEMTGRSLLRVNNA